MRLKSRRHVILEKTLWLRPILWTLYCALIVVLSQEYNFIIDIPLAIPSILGTAISLFLGFRTNSAYQRWWEARKIWGEIINNSRTFARQILCFGKANNTTDKQEEIIKRQIAWNWLLAYKLRGLGWSKESEKYLSTEEVEILRTKDNITNYLLLKQEKEVGELIKTNEIDDFYFRKIDSTIKEICDSLGKCERIKTTVFPTRYALFTLVFVNIFLFLLPLGMVKSLGYFCIPIHLVIGFTFGMIQSVAESMQSPFENKPNDIPLFSICTTIERNLLEMLDIESLPKPYKAEKNILM